MSSSMVALIVAFLLLVQVHACTARHPFRSLIFSQDAEKTKLVHEMYINSIEDTTSSAENISIATFNKNTGRLMELEGLKGKPRSMLESNNQSHNETKEKTNVNEGDEPVEEAVVMDYVQIHRKSPIHNHH